MKRNKGFTLIELMLVVAIIGLLAAIAVPKFADMVTKAREASTKGYLGAVRSALSIYYADNGGVYPSYQSFVEGSTMSLFANELPNYLQGNPRAICPNTYCLDIMAPHVMIGDEGFLDDNPRGGWLYHGLSTYATWGTFSVRCSDDDSRGYTWASF